MSKLRVHLLSSTPSSFDVVVHNTCFAQKWLANFSATNTNQFSQWETLLSFRTPNELLTRLHYVCEKINQKLKRFIEIDYTASIDNQEYFNYLHVKFEELSGGFETPTKFFMLLPAEYKQYVRELNLLIHTLEHRGYVSKQLYVAYVKDDLQRFPFSAEDYVDSVLEVPPGAVVLNYVELGKHIYDLYEDDLPISYENYRNLHYYSNELVIKFNKISFSKVTSGFRAWANKVGFDISDLSQGHGDFVIGQVEDIQLAKELCSNATGIKQIEVING